MKGSSRQLLFLFIVLLLAACTTSQQGDGSQAEAKRIYEQYFAAIQAGDIDRAAALYPLEEQPRWREFLQQAAAQRGAMMSYSLDGIEENTVFSGKFYLFNVSTNNANFDAGEIVTLFKKLDEDRMHVVAHKIKPLTH